MSPKDICEILKTNKDAKIFLNKDGNAFTVDYGELIHTEWFKMEIEEFEWSKFYSRIKTVYCISHHSSAINWLLPELKKLIDKFGGFLGNDSEEFEPLYDENNVMLFNYE